MTDKQVKLFTRLLKEIGIFKMYCNEKHINSCKTAFKDIESSYTPSYVIICTLCWAETHHPTFWMNLSASLCGISWNKLESDMDDCVKIVKNYKGLLDFHFW